ncbi:hypothetical protein GQX74_000879 [Glossina fuscipes]|nr:hypothetical protein GQX74_000879 [Glossina fuscipes]
MQCVKEYRSRCEKKLLKLQKFLTGSKPCWNWKAIEYPKLGKKRLNHSPCMMKIQIVAGIFTPGSTQKTHLRLEATLLIKDPLQGNNFSGLLGGYHELQRFGRFRGLPYEAKGQAGHSDLH